MLLDTDSGALNELAQELGQPHLALALTPDRIHLVADRAGRPLQDILEPEDNVAAADTITRLVRTLTADPASALHVSLAGGRKTMGFFAGYALSLYGRAQDRLSHVLVPPAFEQHPQFFFPPARPRVLIGRDNRPVRTDQAAVTLADIPFVRLRHGLPRDLLLGQASYAEAVAGLQHVLAAPELRIDIAGARLTMDGRPVRLPPAQLAWLLVPARRRRLGKAALVGWRELRAREVVGAYLELFGEGSAQLRRLRGSLARGMSREFVEERNARHNKLVGEALGECAVPYRVVGTGRRPLTRYRLALPPESILIVGEPDP